MFITVVLMQAHSNIPLSPVFQFQGTWLPFPPETCWKRMRQVVFRIWIHWRKNILRMCVHLWPLLSVEQQVFSTLGICTLIGLEERQGFYETHQLTHRDRRSCPDALDPVVSYENIISTKLRKLWLTSKKALDAFFHVTLSVWWTTAAIRCKMTVLRADCRPVLGVMCHKSNTFRVTF